MDPVREEDEEVHDAATRKSFKLTLPNDQALSTRTLACLPRIYPLGILYRVAVQQGFAPSLCSHVW